MLFLSPPKTSFEDDRVTWCTGCVPICLPFSCRWILKNSCVRTVCQASYVFNVSFEKIKACSALKLLKSAMIWKLFLLVDGFNELLGSCVAVKTVDFWISWSGKISGRNEDIRGGNVDCRLYHFLILEGLLINVLSVPLHSFGCGRNWCFPLRVIMRQMSIHLRPKYLEDCLFCKWPE